MNTPDLLNPLLDPSYKGYPASAPPLHRSALAQQGWNALDDDQPLPIALLKQSALEHNLRWMQTFVRDRQIDLAPHGKTTLSPQLFQRQLAAGAWGLTFATVAQLHWGLAAGARRILIANQVLGNADLAALQALFAAHADLQIHFLVDSLTQLELIEQWFAAHPGSVPFTVLLEVGVPGARTGCRTEDEALQLAARLHASPAVQLVGIECYEGGGATGDNAADSAYTDALMQRVAAIARACDERGYFSGDEILLSAGGSALFDLVVPGLRTQLSRPTRGLLRSGCYITHDHGHYTRLVNVLNQRIGCRHDQGLRPALEIWTLVQSCPEPGLALLAAGRRDLSFDVTLPIPVARAERGSRQPRPVPKTWTITALNDQHAYLRWNPDEAALAPRVGERVGLGISHPCTTFDKWRWMPVVDDDYRIVDAITTHF